MRAFSQQPRNRLDIFCHFNWPESAVHPESEIGQLQISVIIQTIKDTYCFGFVVYLRTSLTWPRDNLLFRFKKVHSGAGR